MLRSSQFTVVQTKSGTRYQKIKTPPRAPREDFKLPSEHLQPFLSGEAEGDYTLAVIMAVRNLLAKEAHWNRGRARALDKRGEPIPEPASPEAISWSVIGAIEFVTHPADRATRHKIVEAIKKGMPKDDRASLFKWEEKSTTRHAHILHALNMSIAFRRNELGMNSRAAK